MVNRKPAWNVNLAYSMYIPLNFSESIIYEQGPYMNFIYHFNTMIKLELGTNLYYRNWTSGADSIALGNSYSVTEKVLKARIGNKHLFTYSELFSSVANSPASKHFSLIDFLELVHEEDKQNLLDITKIFFNENKEILTFDLRVKDTKGKYQWIEIIDTLERDTNENPLKLAGILIKVGSRKKIEIKLKKEAETDHLTGILNRRVFWEKLDHQINKSKNRNNSFHYSFLILIILNR